MVSFETTKGEAAIIHKIAIRATKMAKGLDYSYPLIDAEMDITAVHVNDCRLRLGDLLTADDTNFAHDIFGILRHINRETGKLLDCFVPRYSA